jgi:hypothetical protein
MGGETRKRSINEGGKDDFSTLITTNTSGQKENGSVGLNCDLRESHHRFTKGGNSDALNPVPTHPASRRRA